MKIYPFKFLDSYTKNDKDIFFGRSEETRQLYEMLTQTSTVLVYGASGTGKTSLIQCGLAQKINDYDWLPFYIRRGNNLNESLKNALQQVSPPQTQGSVSDFLDELMDEKPQNQHAHPVVESLRSIHLNHFKPIYLIFDQFEELYVLGNRNEQDEFVATIQEILTAGQAVKLIFSIREEYLGHLYEFEKAVPQLLRKKLRVEPMHRDKVQQIISGVSQYEHSNISIAPEELENFTARMFEKIKAKNELTIQLPYLQVFLDKLYLSITNDNQRQEQATFTTAALEKLGDIGDVLSEFLEEQVSEVAHHLRQKHPQTNTKTVWEMLSPFATLDGTKDPLTATQLYQRLPAHPKPLTDQMLTAFTKRRILRYTEADTTYELMHDALAQRIAEKRGEDEIAMLQARQLVKSQSSLKPEARELFTEKQLVLITPFAAKLNLTPTEQQLIAQSEKAIEQQRTAKLRRQRRIIATVTAAALVAIALAVFGIVMWKKAEKQTQIAEEQKTIAIQKQQEADSLYRQVTITNFNKYYEKAIDLANDKNYVEAIEQLEIAKDFAADSNLVKTENKIQEYTDIAGNEIKFKNLIEQAQQLEKTEAKWLQALGLYRQALLLDYDNATAQQKISSLQTRVKQKLKIYKNKVEEFWTGNKQQVLRDWITPAKDLCNENYNQDYYNYFIQKEKQCKNQ